MFEWQKREISKAAFSSDCSCLGFSREKASNAQHRSSHTLGWILTADPSGNGSFHQVSSPRFKEG